MAARTGALVHPAAANRSSWSLVHCLPVDGAPQTAALAPFTGTIAVDAQVADRVLRAALADGGEYADLFFEPRRSLHLILEDGRVRSVGAGVDAGVGIRVVQGGAVGFAYAGPLGEVDGGGREHPDRGRAGCTRDAASQGGGHARQGL